MLKMTEQQDEEPPSSPSQIDRGGSESMQPRPSQSDEGSVVSFIKGFLKPKSDSSLRETIEEYIEENSGNDNPSISAHEKNLITNVLELRDITAADIMVPRADIVAVSKDTTQEELFALLGELQYSRIPVYNNTLDNVLGSIHVKDIICAVARGEAVNVQKLIRDVPIVSPAINLLDLLLQMRMTRKHMVLVIDEFGGIDGLVTIGDIIEAIVGTIDDEHDPNQQPNITENPDGTIIADARYNLEDFEKRFGKMFTKDEKEDNDTLGGLVISIAGRVPARGEIIKHDAGITFEVIDADPRRVNALRIRELPGTEENIFISQE